jgi:hypothetical protein
MLLKSVKTSKQGLVQIRDAIADKEWNRSDDRLSLAASIILEPSVNWEEHWQQTQSFAYGCSKLTRDRFLKGDAIREDTFRAFCRALELNPYEIAEDLEPAPFKTSELLLIETISRVVDPDNLLPTARQSLQTILNTSERQISIKRKELMQKPLPEKFKVYVKGGSIISHHEPGYEEKVLPTVNIFRGKNGGYVAFYTRDSKVGVYAVGGGFYSMGQIRLPGEYFGRIFVPEGCEDKDLNTVQWLKDLGNQHFPSAKGNIWAGGDTGGWFDPPSLVG